jgi:hypothetical protein
LQLLKPKIGVLGPTKPNPSNRRTGSHESLERMRIAGLPKSREFNLNPSPSKLWIKLKYSFEFIYDFEIFSHFPKPGSLQNFLMPRSMLSKLKGGAQYCLIPKPLIYNVFGLLSLETDLSKSVCCPNCGFLKKLIWTSLLQAKSDGKNKVGYKVFGSPLQGEKRLLDLEKFFLGSTVQSN